MVGAIPLSYWHTILACRALGSWTSIQLSSSPTVLSVADIPCGAEAVETCTTWEGADKNEPLWGRLRLHWSQNNFKSHYFSRSYPSHTIFKEPVQTKKESNTVKKQHLKENQWHKTKNTHNTAPVSFSPLFNSLINSPACQKALFVLFLLFSSFQSLLWFQCIYLKVVLPVSSIGWS